MKLLSDTMIEIFHSKLKILDLSLAYGKYSLGSAISEINPIMHEFSRMSMQILNIESEIKDQPTIYKFNRTLIQILNTESKIKKIYPIMRESKLVGHQYCTKHQVKRKFNNSITSHRVRNQRK